MLARVSKVEVIIGGIVRRRVYSAVSDYIVQDHVGVDSENIH